MGSLIAIEGVDGSGKGTQAEALAKHLQANDLTVQVISFPRYTETRFGQMVGRFLNGDFGKINEVSPELAALLFAGDRFESRDYLCSKVAQSDVVILDRYVASNIAHQVAKLHGGEARSRLLSQILEIEYEVYRLPKPEMTILLDLPISLAQQLIAQKNKRAYTDKAADIHEADGAYLEQVRRVYRFLADGEPNWRVVAVQRHIVGHGDVIRDKSDVATEIANHFEDWWKERAARRA